MRFIGPPGAMLPSPRRTALAASVLDLQPRLARVESREVHDVLGGEVRDLALHDRILAPAVLVVVEDRLDVIGILAREIGEGGAGTHAVGAVARGARAGLLLADLGVARRGGRGKRECEKRESEEFTGHGRAHFASAGAAAVETASAP